MTTVPNPGSPEAKRLGCSCDTMDNAHGKGYRYIEGEPLRFVITERCPFHWPPEDDFEIIIPSGFGHQPIYVRTCDSGWLAANEFTSRFGIGVTAGEAIMELVEDLERHKEWLRGISRDGLSREFQTQLDALEVTEKVNA